jgi:serine/threonine protein kinase
MPADLQRARELFLHAVGKLPPEQWDGYVGEACGGDTELEQQIGQLLQVHRQAGSFLDRPALDVGVTDAFTPLPGEVAAETPLRERPGAIIGPYKLLQELGEGGMGTVFMAEQTRPVQRKVALKVIKAGMDSRQVIGRFEAERQALAMMDHVNIARVLDAGTTDSGRPYFVMELIQGVPITKYCDDNQLTPRERLELFVPVCQAIQHAHQKGIIHRDLKPSNVMVTLYDGKPVPKVIDFGVAKATEQKLTERTLFTQFGTMVGTFEYMSPEQAEMSALGVDTRSDIFSLGVLLYELLTGSTPLSHNRVRQAAYGEILRMIKEEEPPKPSTRLSDSGEKLASISVQRHMEPAKLTKLMRGDMDWIVMKCLEKARARRYETASALAADLRRYLSSQAVEACPPSPFYTFRKFALRNRAALAMATVMVASLLAVAAALAVSNVLLNAKQREILRKQSDVVKAYALLGQKNEEILKERDSATSAAARAEAINTFLTVDLLGEASPDQNARDKKVTVEELLARAARKIDSSHAIGRQPEVEAGIRDAIGTTYHKLGMPAAALIHLQKAVTLRGAAFGPENRQTLAAQEHLADFMNRALHRPDLAEPLSYQTWQARRRVLGPEDPDTLDSLDTYGCTLSNLHKLDTAEARLAECLEARTRILGPGHGDTLTTLNNLSCVFADQGKLDKAIEMGRSGLTLRRKEGGLGNTEAYSCLNNLSKALFLAGDLGEAETLLREGLQAIKKTHGPEHQKAVHLQYMLSQILLDEGKLDEAESLGRETLAQRRMAGRPSDEDIGRSLLILGRTLLEKGKTVEAEGMLRESAGLFREHYQARSDLIASADSWHGASLARLGKFAEAEPLLVNGFKNYLTESSVPPRNKEKIRNRIVNLYEAWGKPEMAAHWRATRELK